MASFLASPPLDDFELLLRGLQPTFKHILARHGVPAQDSQDLVQETCEVALLTWQAVSNPHGWMVAILKNRCRMYWRKRRAERLIFGYDNRALERLARPLLPLQERKILLWDLERYVRRLCPWQQAAFKLRYGLGCTAAETARHFERSPGTLDRALRRSIVEIRELARSGKPPTSLTSR